MKRFLIILVILAAAGGGGWYWWKQSHQEKPREFKTAKADRGTMVQTVKATGIVQPVLTVLVGTQVNGPVQKLYVDYNSVVKAGDLVAQIDPSVYKARVAQDEANLAQAKASLEEVQARLKQSARELDRSRELAKRDLISQSDLDAAVASFDTLTAQVKVSEASVEQAKATAQVSAANLSYTTIRAPVDGVVIARNVSEGQTVVASMSAQTLFTIATDLSRIQIEASIPEADIGKVAIGQPVAFTVDAHDMEFTGTVAQIRLASSSTQNVVTYPVVIRADNPNGKLYPGMTANISCEVARREDVLRVPNAVLRFKPDDADLANVDKPANGNGGGTPPAAGAGPHSGGGMRPGGSGGGAGSGRSNRQSVWLLDTATQKLKPVQIKLGINDGAFTEVREPTELAAGADLVSGYVDPNASSAPQGAVNPFAPPRPGGGSRR